MKRILAFLNLLVFLLFFAIPYAGFGQKFQKVSIEIYKELENGHTTKKDTIINLEDLDKVVHLMGPQDVESLRTAIFLAEGGETRITSKKENGIKTIQIGQYEGDDWENLDEETQQKVKEAYKIANIPMIEEDPSNTPVNREISQEKELRKVTWDGKTTQTANLSGQKVEINRNDLSASQEQALIEAMQTQEVSSLLSEMNVELSLKGERPSPPPGKIYTIGELTPEEQAFFRSSGLLGKLAPLGLREASLTPSDSNTSYLLVIESEENAGEMAVTLKDPSGNVLIRDTHPSQRGKYVKEFMLGDSFNNIFFLTLAQNGKITHKRIFATVENLETSTSY